MEAGLVLSVPLATERPALCGWWRIPGACPRSAVTSTARALPPALLAWRYELLREEPPRRALTSMSTGDPPFYRCFAVIVTPLTKMQVRGGMERNAMRPCYGRMDVISDFLVVVQLRMPPLPGILNELLSNPPLYYSNMRNS